MSLVCIPPAIVFVIPLIVDCFSRFQYSPRPNDVRIESSLQDIIDYLKWEEKYITNIGALAKCYEDPEEDGDYLEEETISGVPLNNLIVIKP